MTRLRLLGGAAVEDDAGETAGVSAHRHAVALFALLALAPAGESSRAKLVGMLWPEAPERTARNRLNTYVHRIRSELGEAALLSVGDRIRLNRAVIECDVWAFEKALEAEGSEGAVQLYGGPFLDGFVLDGSPEFEKWMDREAGRLARGYRTALITRAEDAERHGELATAASWWQELAWEDPYDSGAALHLMRTLWSAGNRAAALRAGRRHAALVEEELGVEPDADVRAMLVTLEAAPGGTPPTRAPGPGGSALDHSAVAILPFENPGGGDEAALFADGLHDDLLTRLSRVCGITVISRSSVLRYRAASASIGEIGRALGVGTIVEGSVQRESDRLRLNVQLIDASTDTRRWAEAFECRLTAGRMFDIQGELAGRITACLRAQLTPREMKQAVEWVPTEDLEAYRLHALGRSRLDERTESSMRKAAECFREALERDPAYAPAWVGLADTLTLLNDYGFEVAERVLPQAERAARRALELDPDLAEAHASLGLLASVKRDGPESIRRLERAVELQPAYAETCNWLSWVYALLGRPKDALAWGERAVELGPLSPEATANLAIGYLATGDRDSALREARRVSDLQPDWTSGRFLEGIALLQMGRLDDAESVLDGLSVAWTGVGAEATLAFIHVAAGRRELAESQLSAFEAEGEAFAAGLLHLALGDVDRATRRLREARLGDHWPTLAVRFLYPSAWNVLPPDGRYEALIGRVNRAWRLKDDGRFPPRG